MWRKKQFFEFKSNVELRAEHLDMALQVTNVADNPL